MGEVTVIAFIINFAAICFASGALYQKVAELCRRVNRLENLLNSKDKG